MVLTSTRKVMIILRLFSGTIFYLTKKSTFMICFWIYNMWGYSTVLLHWAVGSGKNEWFFACGAINELFNYWSFL